MTDFGLKNGFYIGQTSTRDVTIESNLTLSYVKYYQTVYPASFLAMFDITADVRSTTVFTTTFDIQVVDADSITTVYYEKIGATVTGTTPETFTFDKTAEPFPTSDFNLAVYAKYRSPNNARILNLYFVSKRTAAE